MLTRSHRRKTLCNGTLARRTASAQLLTRAVPLDVFILILLRSCEFVQRGHTRKLTALLAAQSTTCLWRNIGKFCLFD